MHTVCSLRLLAGACLLLAGAALGGCNPVAQERVDDHLSNMPGPNDVKSIAPPATSAKKTTAPPPSEAELGMPVYPGAQTYTDASGTPVTTSAGADSAMAMLQTPASLADVTAFYQQRLQQPGAARSAAPTVSEEKDADGTKRVNIAGSDAQGNIVVVVLHEQSGKTVIELMRTQLRSLPSSVSGTPATAGGGSPDAAGSGSTPGAGVPGAGNSAGTAVPSAGTAITPQTGTSGAGSSLPGTHGPRDQDAGASTPAGAGR